VNDFPSKSPFAGGNLEVGGCAVFVLDPSGIILSANASARRLWLASESKLIGASFASLFTLEVRSADPALLQAQWNVIVASALDRSAPFTPQPRDSSAREMRVRLEKIVGPVPGYIATVLPAEAVSTGPAEKLASLPSTAGHDAEAMAAAYTLLAEKSDAGFFDLNLATRQVTFSPVWKRLLGYAPDALPDTLDTWHRLIHPDDSAAAPDKIGRKAAAGTRPFSVEFRMKHERGHWVWIQCIGVQLVGAAGELQRVVGLHLDVTERKELEEASLANDARLQDLSGVGPLAAFELDFAHHSFWFSPAWEQFLGYTPGELVPSPASFAKALPPGEAAEGVEAWLLARMPGAHAPLEAVRLVTKDGHTIPVLLGLHRTVTRKRELARVVGFACALPSGALADDGGLPPVLAEGAFGALSEGVIVTDARGRILLANAAALRLLHATAENVRGQPCSDVFRLVNRQSGRPVDNAVDRALTADQPLPLISADALLPAAGAPATATTPLPVVWTARAGLGPGGAARGGGGVFRNPDEMSLTPEELVKANRFESLGLLAGSIAHDFNNLLTTILGSVSLAKDNRDYSGLGNAEQACLTAKSLTKQLLSFARGESGVQTACASKAILQDSIAIAASASTAEVVLDIAEGTDHVLVDRSQILQVFQNLIVNALQAMPPTPHQPRVQVRASNASLAEQQVPALPAGDYVAFEVRDNGSGIKPEHLEKIFAPFFTTKKHGTGLGLATVLSIVRKHGGQIAVESQVGAGTAFTVYLPKADRPLEVQARRAPSLRFGTGRVLFMDDDPKISTLTATMLQSLDYTCDLARNGEEAIALYRRYLNIGRPYDAVIMDLTVIGGMGGEECYYELRKLDPEVRAIVASGYDNADLARQFLEKGFCGYLTKPYRVADLGKVLKTVLG
jgi:PAS domain S-box-containing protein